MKNLLVLFVLLFSITFYSQKKAYYTEEFKELSSAEGATYYSIYEDNKEGTSRTTYLIDGTKRNYDEFSNFKKRILNGISESWYQSGTLELTSFFVKGKQEGALKRYYENGQIKRTENYKSGELIDGKCFDENGTEITFFPYSTKPEFPGGMSQFYKYIGKNFKIPNSAKGQIKVTFFVEKDGSLKDFKIIEGLNYDMNIEVLRVLFNSPLWIPGKVDGKDARTKYGIPITIK